MRERLKGNQHTGKSRATSRRRPSGGRKNCRTHAHTYTHKLKKRCKTNKIVCVWKGGREGERGEVCVCAGWGGGVGGETRQGQAGRTGRVRQEDWVGNP